MNSDNFVWYELVTNDVDAALGFYGKVVGWEGSEFTGSDGRYVIVSAGGKGVGGMMQLPEGMNQPFWLSYVGVSEIHAAIAKLEGADGAVHRAFDIPNIGRIALVSDPQGVGFAMIQGASDQPSEAFHEHTPGHGNWNELHTTDWEAAWRFYSGQFGWGKDAALDMGPMGTYQLMTEGRGGVLIGAMFAHVGPR